MVEDVDRFRVLPIWLEKLLDDRIDLGNCEANVSQHNVVVFGVAEGDQCSPATKVDGHHITEEFAN